MTTPVKILTPTPSQPQSTLVTNRSPRPDGGAWSSAVVSAMFSLHLIMGENATQGRKRPAVVMLTWREAGNPGRGTSGTGLGWIPAFGPTFFASYTPTWVHEYGEQLLHVGRQQSVAEN